MSLVVELALHSLVHSPSRARGKWRRDAASGPPMRQKAWRGAARRMAHPRCERHCATDYEYAAQP